MKRPASALKIAVYAICRNESAHVKRFVSSVREADHVIVCDTGSTDDTPDRLVRAGARVYHIAIDPWRFDHARNVALSCVPSDVDVCVSMDLDEVASPGWREAIESAWTPGTTRLRYLFAWSHHADGTNDIAFYADKVHARHGYRWEYPVHEFLSPTDPAKEVFGHSAMEVHHWPDDTKSRSSYLPLLKLSAIERPDDHRAALYYGRELMFRGEHEKAITELSRYLDLPSAKWHIERAAAMRWIARCYRSLRNDDEAWVWLRLACSTAPDEREPWVELAKLDYDQDHWDHALWCLQNAFRVTERPKHYLTEAHAWGSWLGQLAATCSLLLKEFPNDLSVGERTGEHNSDEARIVNA